RSFSYCPPALYVFPTRRSSDLRPGEDHLVPKAHARPDAGQRDLHRLLADLRRVEPLGSQPLDHLVLVVGGVGPAAGLAGLGGALDRKSTRLNSSHVKISYAVFC